MVWCGHASNKKLIPFKDTFKSIDQESDDASSKIFMPSYQDQGISTLIGL